MNIHHMIRSPPTSPEQEIQYIHSPPSSPSSFDTSTQHCQYEDDPATHSLQERRQRNKAASAKYRQKKNMQQHEMRTMIHEISERNAVLERQLREVREENQKLRAAADKLRGKFVAKKLLRQWMDRHSMNKHGYSSPPPPHELLDEVNDDDLDSLCSDL
jgi:predicted ribosome quality control (RQC) complex YloA/Tae2 family protein